jgi:catechol-2,3-dioxygenase
MQIVALRLPTADLAALRGFYTARLGLPLEEEHAAEFTVRVGASRLHFFASGAIVPPQHFALTIPRNQLAAAKAWLHGRAALLTQDGQDEFSSADWQTQQVYFRDPAGNILEFIARQTLPGEAEGPFDPAQMISVSEIGLPTSDVPATVAALSHVFGLAPYGEVSDTFTAVGDAEGLLIVVRDGRNWFPTTTTAAAVQLIATIAAPRAGEFAHDGWVVRGV